MRRQGEAQSRLRRSRAVSRGVARGRQLSRPTTLLVSEVATKDLPWLYAQLIRHQTVNGTASPDDPALTRYWAARRRRIKPPLDSYTLRLLDRQGSCCPLCGDPVLTADQPPGSPQQWENWWLAVTRKAIQHDYLVHHGRPARPGSPDGDQTRLVHASCQRALHARHRRSTAHPPCSPQRLA